MTYLPPVVARLSMDLGDFDAKIDEAKAKIKSLGDTVRIKTDVSSNGAGSLRSQLTDLEKIAREASRINNRNVMSLKLADGTRTWEELIAIDREMARLNGKTARVHVKVDKDGFLNDIKQMFSGIGGALGGGHSFNLPFTSMTASPIGVAGIAGGIAALLPELAGLLAGFTAAGAGAAAFGALALPAIHSVSQALSQIQKDQLAYNRATTSKQREAALAHLKDDLKGLDPLQRQAVQSIQQFSKEYHKASKAFEPQAMKVLTGGLKLLNDLLPHVTPFASTFATSMDKWLGNLDRASKSKGFQDFIKQFHGIEGPALQSITAGIGNVAGSIGRLLTVMSGKDVAHTINIAFSAISGTIGGITASVRFLMNAFDGMKLFGHDVASTFDRVRHDVASIGSTIGRDFMSIIKSPVTIFKGLVDGAKTAAHGVASAFDTIRHDIAAKFDSVKSAIVSKFAGAGNWLASKAHDIASAFDHVRHDIAAKFDGIKDAVVSKFNGAIGWLKQAGEDIMNGLLAGIKSAWGKVAGFLSSLAGKIKSLKGPLDYDRVMLYPHGQAIMQGLMGGMQSQVPALESQLKGITNTISNTAGHAASGGGAPIHVHVHLDGRQIYSAVQDRAVTTQRRTGHAGLSKRTR